ncbi:hypothetical protein NKR23_g12231 [Pleurostoma richardsiae]|uniref:Kinesin light chain n=1 Tax=Pleurostoma richardsiae TaxID=41990 RepID=A0AA38R6A8_9PEZI|nr:hypothetical protein NKR23_g12231 [Pleurostoma richardsiae]
MLFPQSRLIIPILRDPNFVERPDIAAWIGSQYACNKTVVRRLWVEAAYVKPSSPYKRTVSRRPTGTQQQPSFDYRSMLIAIPTRSGCSSNTIVATWHITYEQVRREWPPAADLLSLMSFFLLNSVPESVLRSHRCEAGGHDFDEDIEILRRYSLVESAAESGVLATQSLLYPTAECEDWNMYRTLDAHVENIIGTIPRDSADTMRWAVLLTNAAWCRGMSGRYIEVEAMLRAVVDAREQVLGVGHPDTLTGINNLAQVLSEQGKRSESERLHRPVLGEREKTLGCEHAHADERKQPCGLLWDRDMCGTAVQMQRQALHAREKVLGEDYPHMLASANNLASMLLV